MALIWHDAKVFDCNICRQAPEYKKAYGCDAPPRTASGKETQWQYPPAPAPARIILDRCPAKIITHDTVALVTALNMAGGNISLSEQENLPHPYLQALVVARNEQAEKSAYDIERSRDSGRK